MQGLILFKEQISMIVQSLNDFLFFNSEFKSIILMLSIFLLIHAFIIVKPSFGYDNSRGWLNSDILVCALFEIFMLLLGLLTVVYPLIDKSSSPQNIELSTLLFGFFLQLLKIMIDMFRDSTEII